MNIISEYLPTFNSVMQQSYIDPCGENGEFHTVVIDGPLFNHAIHLKKNGEPSLHSGYWVQDFVMDG